MNLSSRMSFIDEIALPDRSKSDSELNMRFSLPSILAFTREYMSSRRIFWILLFDKLRFLSTLSFDKVNKLLFKIESDGAILFPSKFSVCSFSNN